MRLIHDAVERVIKCDTDGNVTERVEGYEMYEHFERIKLLVYRMRDDGEIEKWEYQLKHEDLYQFCNLYAHYCSNQRRQVALRKHVLEAAKCLNVRGYCRYYSDHLVEMAALRVSLPAFVQACIKERKKQDLPMSS